MSALGNSGLHPTRPDVFERQQVLVAAALRCFLGSVSASTVDQQVALRSGGGGFLLEGGVSGPFHMPLTAAVMIKDSSVNSDWFGVKMWKLMN